MTLSVNTIIPTNTVNFTANTNTSTSHHAFKQIPRDHYFPRYKCEDRVRAFFFECGLIDETGKIDRYLVHLSELPLNPEEQSRVKTCLTKVFTIIDHRVGVNLHAHEILSAFLTPSQANEILPELFNHLEIVGSAVNQCLGVSFFKRFTEHLFRFAFSEKNDAFIQDLVSKVFTPEFEGRLSQRLNHKLADLDLRLSANTPLHNGQALMCIQNAIDKMMSILIAKMPVLDAEKETQRRNELLNLLKNRLSILDWNWLSTDDPQFYYHVIKNLAFNKLALITKEGEHFGIINLGHSSEFVVDFVFVLDLPRLEMFPAVRIPCLSQLNPATEQLATYPTGENWVQALSDTLFGCVRPDISKATEDDFKMLQCRKTKGEVNAVPGSELALLNIVREESVNSRNKVVKKILKNHPELRHKPKNNFPYFLAQMMKDAVETHFDKDPMAAVALTINTCESLRGYASYEEMEIFVQEMHSYWKPHYYDRHPLYAIARLFTETLVLNTHNSLARKLSLVRLCAFLSCQASAGEGAQVNVYPRHNEGKPCLEISIQGNERTYSLMLDGQSPHTMLRETLKYYQIAKNKDILESIQGVIECFLPKAGFGGAWSTPMLDDLRFFDHNLEFFEKAATSSLLLQHPLFGLFLLFATQAQLGENIPLQPVFIQFPLIISKIPKHKDFAFDHLIKLTTDQALIEVLKKMKTYTENNKCASEDALCEQWIELLSQSANTLPLAKQSFIETFHQAAAVDEEKRKDVLFKLYHQCKKIDASFAITLLQFIQEKSYTTPRGQLKLLDNILDIEFTLPQDVFRLEKIAEHLIQALRRGKGIRKEDLDALNGMLAKLALISPKAEVMIQKLQTPVYSFVIEQGVLRHELIKQHVDSIESLIATDYEMAAEGLYELAQVIHSVSPDRILSIVEKIVTRCLSDNNLALAQVLLRHDMLHDYFMVEPEKFYTLIHSFMDKIENSGTAGKEDARASILQKILKAYVNNQAPRISLETTQRLVDNCIGILNDPCYLLKPIPESYIRTLTQAFNSLFFALSAKKAYLHSARLYHAMYTFDTTNPNISKSALYACESLEHLLVAPNFTQEVENIAGTVMGPILNYCAETNRNTVLKLLTGLFEHVASVSQKFAHLEHLATMGSLDRIEILHLLFPFFEQLASTDQDVEALNAIRFFTGSISSEDFPDSRRFHSFMGKLIRNGQWKLVCDALAINPFVWTHPSFMAKQVEYANSVLQKVADEDSLSLMELKQIFRVIEKYALSDTVLITRFYEKCIDAMDEALAHQMLSVFKKQVIRSKTLAAQQAEQPLFVVLNALKFLPVNEVEQLLKDVEFLSFCQQNVSPQVCLNIYKLLWKALLHMIKASKATEKQRIFKEMNAYFEAWIKALGIVNETYIQEARIELIDYYLNVNEPEMLPRAIEHFVVLGTQLNASPHLRDRLNKILRIIHARIVNLSEKDTASVALNKIVEAISRSDIPPLSQSKCLKFCYDSTSQASGLKIIQNCLAIKTFSREEIASLKNYNFYQFLLHVIENLNPENLSAFETILNNPRLRLFLNKNELATLESMLAAHYCAEAEVDPNKMQRSIDYLYAKLGGIARVNHKDHFENFAQSFFDCFFVKKEDHFLIKLSETVKQSENGTETLLALTHAMKRLIYEQFWENCDEPRAATFVRTVNDLLIEGLPKRVPITETELKHLKMWVLLQSSSERLAITQLSQQFVATLMIVLKNYPQDLFETRFLHSLMMRETASDYMLEHADQMHRCFKNTTEMIDDLKDKINPRQLYEDNKHGSKLANVLPFKDETARKDELKILLNCAFNSITALPSHEQASALDEMTLIWSEAVGKDLDVLYGTLLCYLPETHDFWIMSLKKKLNTYLNLVHLKKAQLKASDFFQYAIQSFSGLVDERIKRMVDAKTLEEKKEENQRIVAFFKDVYEAYTDFCTLATTLHLTPEDKFTACDHYTRILDLFLRNLPRHVSILDPGFITQVFSNARLLLSMVPKNTSSLRAKCNAMEQFMLPKMQKEFEKRCHQFKAT